MSEQKTDIQKLPQLLKMYVALNNAEYKRAKKLISERSTIQNRIKKIMRGNSITEFHTSTDKVSIDISFQIRVREAIDDMIIPVEIKNQYIKQIETWLETLIVEPLS
jgi:hypothetical protein